MKLRSSSCSQERVGHADPVCEKNLAIAILRQAWHEAVVDLRVVKEASRKDYRALNGRRSSGSPVMKKDSRTGAGWPMLTTGPCARNCDFAFGSNGVPAATRLGRSGAVTPSASGNRPSFNLEKMSLPSRLTSKRPPARQDQPQFRHVLVIVIKEFFAILAARGV